eukprot:12116238-Heterocapsa_arctica.AAC.1
MILLASVQNLGETGPCPARVLSPLRLFLGKRKCLSAGVAAALSLSWENSVPTACPTRGGSWEDPQLRGLA